MVKQGVYAIICDKTWRSYIGSSVNIHERTREHLLFLKKDRHINIELQKDFNKYGAKSFNIEVLEEVVNHKDLLNREERWKEFGCNLYNKITQSDIILTNKQIDKFWSHVDVKSKNECWNWKLSPSFGYGQFHIVIYGKSKGYKAHRIALYLFDRLSWNKNMIVCHKCDNRLCCNPNHLYLGSNKDNGQDRRDRNRNPQQILNWDLVGKIRELCKENPYLDSIEFHNLIVNKLKLNLGVQCTRGVVENKSWYDENWNPKTKICLPNIGERHSQARLTWEIVNYIRNEYSCGNNNYKDLQSKIQDKFGIAYKNIKKIVRNTQWIDNSYIVPLRMDNARYRSDV